MEEVKKIIAMPLVEPRSQQSSYNSLGKSLGIKRDYLRISSGDEEEIITDEEKTDNDETDCDEITSNIEHVVTSDIEPNKNVSSPPALTDGSKIVDNTPPSPTKRAKLTMSN